ncbi:MAG TPA: hypothetical protein VHM90_15205 [Phycisphaerae bacterium]|nr:hypothetical protein [Phycisphaerae bacterium]
MRRAIPQILLLVTLLASLMGLSGCHGYGEEADVRGYHRSNYADERPYMHGGYYDRYHRYHSGRD